jgi:hypothetical protein
VTTTAVTIAAKTTVMNGVTSAMMTGVMIIVDKMTTTAMTTVARSLLRYHRQKGATPTVRFRPPTVRLTSSSVAVRQPRATNRYD